MMTKDFEKYFPLPWKMHRFGEGDNIITASGEPLCYIKCGKTEQNRNACQYLVQCANRMPEAVVLFGIVEEVLTLCATRTFDAETKHLLSHTAEAVQTFKKKLEGGAEDATNP